MARTAGPASSPPRAPAAPQVRPDLQRELYEFEADTYHITPEGDPSVRHRRALVRRLLPKGLEAARVLDVGCGDGTISDDLAGRLGAQVVGMDLAWRRVELARRRAPEGRFAQGSIYELPFADRSFPLVVCTDLLEHLDEPGRALKELARVSSRHVLLTVPWSIQIEKTLCPHCKGEYFLYGHQHSFGKEGIERLARDAGVRVERFEHLIPMFECRRYRWLPPLKWLIWDHFKDTGTLGALLARS